MWEYIGQFIFGFLQYYWFYEVALSKLSGSFNVFFNEGVQGKSIFRGTQRKLLRKRPKNNNKAWIKISKAILSILGDWWETFICSSLPAGLMAFPASKVHL